MGEVSEERRRPRIRVKVEEVFETQPFKEEVRRFLNEVFPRLFEEFRLISAKGGFGFREYPDMSYPMHILNGIPAAMLLLEQKLLKSRELSGLLLSGDADLQMLVRCAMLSIALHDINKLFGTTDLREALERLSEVIRRLGIELSEEEKNIVRYLVLSTEDRTRYTDREITVSLPRRRGLDRVVREYLQNVVHLADTISLPPTESFAETSRELHKRLKRHFDGVHSFHFEDTPYELITRFLLEGIMRRVSGKLLLVSPRGFIWLGEPLSREFLEGAVEELAGELEAKILERMEELVKIDRQKAQLGVFRLVEPSKENVARFLERLLRNKEALYYGISRDERLKEAISKEIEKFDAEKFEIFVLLKLILQLSVDSREVERLKREAEEAYFSDLDLSFLPNAAEILGRRDTGLKNYVKLVGATKRLGAEVKDELITKLRELLEKNYEGEQVSFRKVFREVLNFAYIDGEPLLSRLEPRSLADKRNMCCLCGGEAGVAARDDVAFGFSPRGFTNRTVVSIKNWEKRICGTCLAEIMLRRLAFGQGKEVYTVYVDAYDYTIPLVNVGGVTKRVTEIFGGLGRFFDPFRSMCKFVYGFDPADLPEDLAPFLMAPLAIGGDAEFLARHFRTLLSFVKDTGFKVYLTYAMNPDRVKRATLTFDYAPKALKRLGWDEIRLDEVEAVEREYELLRRLAQRVGGRNYQNELLRMLNDYSAEPQGLAFFFYLYRLDDRSREGFVRAHEDGLMLVFERVGGEKMGVLEKLAELAADIKWSGRSGSKQTWLFRAAFEGLKHGIRRNLGKGDVISLMAGVIERKTRFGRRDAVEKFCKAFYEELYEKIWQGRLPSKNELRYWTYGFAFEYAKKSDERWAEWRERAAEEVSGVATQEG
ncbi:MAG: hypothetical protein OD815_000111 [Candidatus Alkanophagales archaeon MCA70_species_2]|nr:hypothetical protein [Candidatus Alkanophaga liquidiphilum]